MTQAQVGVVPLLVANVGGTLLAYRNACAGCGAPLHRAELDGGLLTCAGCRRRFELPLAGPRGRRGPPARAGAAARGCRARQGRGLVIEGGAIRELRRLANRTSVDRAAPDEPPAAPEERCDLCSASIPADHRHLLHVEERRIVCTCETCRALFAGDGPYRPAGSRTAWLDGFELPDELWASFRIPIGLVFFFRSSTVGGVVAIYPSPAGTTESELDLGAWEELVAANPVLEGLETDVEARDRQPARRRAAACDRPDRRVLPARRPRARELAGDLGRAADRDAPWRASSRSCGRGRRDRGSSRRRASCLLPVLDLEVVDAAAALNVAAPTLHFTLRAGEPTGREVYMVALSTLIHIDPGLRSHDDETRELLVDLFGESGRWAATTTSIVMAQVDVLVPSFTGDDRVHRPGAVQLRPRGGRDEVPLRAAGRRGPAQLPFQRPDLLPRRGRAAAGRDGPLGLGGVPPAGGDVAPDDRPALPRQRLDPGRTRTRCGGCSCERPSAAFRPSTRP